MSNLDQLRARHASGRLDKLFPDPVPGTTPVVKVDGQQESNKPLKEYRSVALNAGAYLRQCGLLQTAAFWGSKKEGDAARKVLHDVVDWLGQSEVTDWICNAGPANSGRDKVAAASPMRALLQRNADEIALLEGEAQNYLLWLKRLTEGLYKDRVGD